MITLRVPGPVRGKGRPRFNRRTGRVYTDRLTKLAEARVRRAWEDAGSPRVDGPVELEVTAVLGRPGSHLKRDGTLSAAGKRSQWPTKTPDLDNAIKVPLDALNRLAFTDDAQVVLLHATKRWSTPSEPEHLQVTIAPVPVTLL